MDLKVSAKEGLEQIKKILFGEDMPTDKPVEEEKMMVEYKLADGTPVMIDKLAEGGQVMVADAPAPDGEHTLEDGTIVSTLGGLITAIKPKLDVEVEVEPLEAGKDKDYMSKADFDAFAKDIMSKFAAQTKATEKTVEVLENMLKFEVDKPLQKPVDFESMTPLQRFRASKNA